MSNQVSHIQPALPRRTLLLKGVAVVTTAVAPVVTAAGAAELVQSDSDRRSFQLLSLALNDFGLSIEKMSGAISQLAWNPLYLHDFSGLADDLKKPDVSFATILKAAYFEAYSAIDAMTPVLTTMKTRAEQLSSRASEFGKDASSTLDPEWRDLAITLLSFWDIVHRDTKNLAIDDPNVSLAFFQGSGLETYNNVIGSLSVDETILARVGALGNPNGWRPPGSPPFPKKDDQIQEILRNVGKVEMLQGQLTFFVSETNATMYCLLKARERIEARSALDISDMAPDPNLDYSENLRAVVWSSYQPRITGARGI